MDMTSKFCTLTAALCGALFWQAPAAVLVQDAAGAELNGVKLIGLNYDSLPHGEIADCRKACIKDKICEGLTFSPKVCLLMRKVIGDAANPGTVSQMLLRPPPKEDDRELSYEEEVRRGRTRTKEREAELAHDDAVFEEELHDRIIKGRVFQRTAAHIEDCRLECKMVARCEAFTHSGGSCKLLKNVEGLEKKAGTTSQFKIQYAIQDPAYTPPVKGLKLNGVTLATPPAANLGQCRKQCKSFLHCEGVTLELRGKEEPGLCRLLLRLTGASPAPAEQFTSQTKVEFSDKASTKQEL